ncbi:MAG: transposase [Pseudomonadota bacterium]
MTRARKHLVCLAQTPFYFITARCVRRAFLCGQDHYSGKCYEHRRGWIEDRLRALSSLLTIQVCAYAIMSNHYHLVVRLNAEDASKWSIDEVLNRWTSLFKGSLLVQRYLGGHALSGAERQTLDDTVSVYRQRLTSLSWFMKCLNEPIARRANAEDCCTGHFWEARFHSRALIGDEALINAMKYVDLNPIRAQMAATLEDSAYTSIRARLVSQRSVSDPRDRIRQLIADGDIYHFDVAVRPLASFATDSITSDDHTQIPIQWPDYLDRLHTLGSTPVAGKRGVIDLQAQLQKAKRPQA